MPARLLVAGPPGCGKTTAVQVTVGMLRAVGTRMGGFVTRERRDRGERFAFDVVALDGASRTMSHVDWDTGVQVGRFGIDVPAFEAVALPALQRATEGSGLVVVDELGLAQLSSPRFVEAVVELFEGRSPILATVHAKSHPVTDAILAGPDVEVVTVTDGTRDRLPAELASRFTG